MYIPMLASISSDSVAIFDLGRVLTCICSACLFVTKAEVHASFQVDISSDSLLASHRKLGHDQAGERYQSGYIPRSGYNTPIGV